VRRSAPSAESIAGARQASFVVFARKSGTGLEEPIGTVGSDTSWADGITGKTLTGGLAPSTSGLNNAIRARVCGWAKLGGGKGDKKAEKNN